MTACAFSNPFNAVCSLCMSSNEFTRQTHKFLLPPQQSGWTEKGLARPENSPKGGNSSVTRSSWSSSSIDCSASSAWACWLKSSDPTQPSKSRLPENWHSESNLVNTNQWINPDIVATARCKWPGGVKPCGAKHANSTANPETFRNSNLPDLPDLPYRCVQTMVSLHAIHTAPVPQSSMSSTSSMHWARSDLEYFEQFLHTSSPSEQNLSSHECSTGRHTSSQSVPISPSWPHCNCHSGKRTKEVATTRRINAECQAAKSST